MWKQVCAVASAGLCLASSAGAVEVIGGSAKLSYSAFTDRTRLDRIGLEGSMQIAFSDIFSAQFDLGHNRAGFLDTDATNFGAHAIYHLDAYNSFGAFVTRERLNDQDYNYFGLEFGVDSGSLKYEGYIAHIDADDNNSSAFGVSARYVLDNGFGLTGSYDKLKDFDASRTGLKIDRDVSQNVNLFVEIGAGKIDVFGVSDSSAFVGLGGKITFGPQGGTTFEQRGIAKLIPGL